MKVINMSIKASTFRKIYVKAIVLLGSYIAYKELSLDKEFLSRASGNTRT